jgi:hypothetical protein
MALLTAKRTLASLGTLITSLLFLTACDDVREVSWTNSCSHSVEFHRRALTAPERTSVEVGQIYPGADDLEMFTLESGEDVGRATLARRTFDMLTTVDRTIIYLEEQTSDPATVDLGRFCDQLRTDG